MYIYIYIYIYIFVHTYIRTYICLIIFLYGFDCLITRFAVGHHRLNPCKYNVFGEEFGNHVTLEARVGP